MLRNGIDTTTRFGDWEMDDTDPMSPGYKSRSEKRIERVAELIFGNAVYLYDRLVRRKEVKRGDYVRPSSEYKDEMSRVPF